MASNRKMALELIKWDYAKHGKDTGVATRNFIENRISYAKYKEVAKIGLDIFKKTTS